MTYTTKQLARLAGITSRSLRFYDQIGLLSPRRITHNSYRVYTQTEVDLLQQILFYRELGLRLEEIKTLLSSEDFDEIETLKSHLAALMERKQQIDMIIQNVQNTIASKEGKKKILFFSPAFVADCLETIYEIKTEYLELFQQHGGEAVGLVESLNATDKWADAVVDLATK